MANKDELSNPEIATIAVYFLGGSVNPIDLEDIAIEVFNLAPKRFSWKRYQDRIDLRIVLYSVNDAIKSDVGYLKGNSKIGYMLTEVGSRWINSIEGQDVITKSSRRFSPSDLADKEKARLQRTQAYRKYIGGVPDQINQIDFREFTRVNDSFPESLREQRYSKIQNVADQDQTLGKLWALLKKKFIEE